VIRRVRLISGLVMLAYVTTHFLNHSLGLVSREAMDGMLRIVQPVWTGLPGSIALYGAFAVHYSLALWALWQRRSLRMPLAEAAQLILGFTIPILLIDHVLAARETSPPPSGGSYTGMLLAMFVTTPWWAAVQLVLLVVAWTHAMIGLWYWLRLRTWYERWQPLLLRSRPPRADAGDRWRIRRRARGRRVAAPVGTASRGPTCGRSAGAAAGGRRARAPASFPTSAGWVSSLRCLRCLPPGLAAHSGSAAMALSA
jgi:hypothetical protein